MAVVLSEMADICIIECKYEEAKKLLEQTIATTRAAFGESHPSVGLHLRDLARVLVAQSRFEDAVQMFTEAATVLESSLGNKHPDVASVYVGQAVRATFHLSSFHPES